MIDPAALLRRLKGELSALEDDIRTRVEETPNLVQHLEAEHAKAVAAGRTSMPFSDWRDGEVTQAAVAWLLGCVFVRFLEDNRLIDRPLISGREARRAAALGRREEYFREHPDHSDREYLEDCFRSVASFRAVAPLYDPAHSPIWMLGPTADGARRLREVFVAIDPHRGDIELEFVDPNLATRFLGDLYQELSESAKKRYALLQTPAFVEQFILDRTLEPALEEFGLQEVRLIDPTCGSGHFLIGAVARLFDRWQAQEPGSPVDVVVQRALDGVYGVDLNPFAVAIARFRLIIAALRAAGVRRLAEAPAFRVHVASGDSLLHGPLPGEGATMLFDANRLAQNISHVFETEDAAELRVILGQGYHAVVGNPPYIVGDDDALRTAYRQRYASCHREFALTVPFMERFFELGRVAGEDGRVMAGFVGKITGNSFTRREFGVRLVENFLPSVDVNLLIDASRAHIPGHATPTVLLFGRARPPVATTVRLVEGLRGEAQRPADPAAGRVWRDLVALADRPGEATLFVRSSDVPRIELAQHPLSLGPGRVLRRRLDEAAEARVKDLATDLGYSGQTNIDDVFLRPLRAWKRAGVSSERVARFVTGVDVRHWAVASGTGAWFPYSDGELLDETELGDDLRALWPWREAAWARRTFEKTSYKEAGRKYYEWHQIALARHRTPLALTWAYKHAHNNFVFTRGGIVFNKHAPFVKLRADTEDAYLELAAVLNSSVACFWLKQVCYDTGIGGIGGGIGDEAWEPRYEFGAGRVGQVPLPPSREVALARRLDELAQDRAALLDRLDQVESNLRRHLEVARAQEDSLMKRLVSLQEELDWQMLGAYGLVAHDLPVLGEHAPPIALGERAFEIVLARRVAAGETTTTWFERHSSTPTTELPADWPQTYRDVVNARLELVESDIDVELVERPENKRRWSSTPWEERQRLALIELVLNELESDHLWSDFRLRSTAELTDHLRGHPAIIEAIELLVTKRGQDVAEVVRDLILDESVPFLAALRHTETGLAKRSQWEVTWDVQRQEDAIEGVSSDGAAEVPVPPRYAQGDFQSALYWKLRGKLDVPKERFVLVRGAERGADPSPVVGWAGWDPLETARAIASRVMELRDQEASDQHRLVPLLAGVLELMPWVHQWHARPDSLYGGSPGRYFDDWLDGQLGDLGVTRDVLRAWRPVAVTGRRARRVLA